MILEEGIHFQSVTKEKLLYQIVLKSYFEPFKCLDVWASVGLLALSSASAGVGTLCKFLLQSWSTPSASDPILTLFTFGERQ